MTHYNLTAAQLQAGTTVGTPNEDTITLVEDAFVSSVSLGDAASIEYLHSAFSLGGTSGDDHFDLSGVWEVDVFNDAIDMGDGNDTYLGALSAETVVGGEGNDTLDGGGGEDELIGGNGNDTLSGGTRADILDGGAGDDILNGGDGADRFLIYGTDAESGFDTFSGGSGAFIDRVVVTADATLSRLILDVAADVESIITYTNASLNGTSGDDHFDFSGLGSIKLRNAVILMGDGIDIYIGQRGADNVEGGVGDDNLSGGDGADMLVGQDGRDTLNGGAGTDIIDGGLLNDFLYGGDNGDTFLLYGSQSGTDFFDGGAGNDRIRLTANTVLTRISLDIAASVESITAAGAFTLSGTSGNDIFNLQGVQTISLNGTYVDLGDGEDRYLGGAAVDRAKGGIGADTLKGGEGNDFLDGGEGDDLLDGGAGADTFLIYGSQSGLDTFRGGTGVDTISLTANTVMTRLILNAPTSIETISAAGAFTLSGTAGADTFDLRAVDTIALNNTYIDLGEGDDRYLGGAAVDRVMGGIGEDVLLGGGGNDVLDGGVGDDRLDGGNGDDLFFLGTDSGNDILRGGAGYDTLQLTTSLMLSRLVLNAVVGVEAIGYVGTPLFLHGTSGDDAFDLSGVLAIAVDGPIDLGEGADRYSGSHGVDNVVGGIGEDLISGGESADILSGGLDNDRLFGDEGADTLDGGAGNDVLNGGDGNDEFLIYGADSGIDTFKGGTGIDTLRLMADTTLTRLILNAAASIDAIDYTTPFALAGTAGDDVFDLSGVSTLRVNGAIQLGDGLDSFIGSMAADVVNGGDGNDIIRGGLGDDTLQGGVGDDTIEGGAGEDRLLGGAGADTFIFGAPTVEEPDTVVSFGSTDILAFHASDYGLPAGALDPSHFRLATEPPTAGASFIFSELTNTLYWDADGFGPVDDVALVILTNDYALSASDILLL